MLKNLIANALKYSSEDDGPVELSYSLEGQVLVLRVRDHGPGISAEQQMRLGEPFYRRDPSRARSSGGTGLGHYLATLVAKAHGGELALDRSDDTGANFEIRLPTT
jgi:two-component system OmpR family sensor kinase